VLFLPAFLPVVAWFLWQGDLIHYAIAAMFLAWVPTVGALARRYSRGLEEALRLRFVNAALVEDLTAQKAIAEQASLAKSRFLASASHDLRQPVHALGMFVGALRGHRLQARSLALIDQVDASVAALDGLFTSLLDISRLDAEAVQNQPADIAVQPLLDRVCRDLAAEAEGRDVALIVVPTRAAIRSDPLLLERVMRNLIGNAVRYTERGAVLVGCRRRGDDLRLEVWDTGPGIAPDQREAVFEEFFQVSNPDRDRSKGLGLGLPIVRRLTDILGHPLEMQSELGKGTVFRVLAPRAQAAEAAVAAIEPSLAAPPGGLILAIDDEQAIRAAMRELLTGWGHQVLAVSGGASAFHAINGGARPDLIICDFRLRDGESGIAVIEALRARLGGDVPAILLTGDTAPENLRLAMASGYPLLHKPLAHARLRAAVGSLIRRPRADGARTAPAV
jgi:signal transduction histidine kinase/CheY-like chemotaxis protein